MHGAGGCLVANLPLANLMRAFGIEHRLRVPAVTELTDNTVREPFTDVTSAVQALVRATLVVLSVDDIPWADEATRRLLQFMATSRGDAANDGPVRRLTILTARPEIADAPAGLFDRLARGPSVRLVKRQPLDETTIAELARGTILRTTPSRIG